FRHRLRDAVLARQWQPATLGIAPDDAVCDRLCADAAGSDHRYTALVPGRLLGLRGGADAGDRGRSARVCWPGSAALDRPRVYSAAAVGDHDDRAGAGARALFSLRPEREHRTDLAADPARPADHH